VSASEVQGLCRSWKGLNGVDAASSEERALLSLFVEQGMQLFRKASHNVHLQAAHAARGEAALVQDYQGPGRSDAHAEQAKGKDDVDCALVLVAKHHRAGLEHIDRGVLHEELERLLGCWLLSILVQV